MEWCVQYQGKEHKVKLPEHSCLTQWVPIVVNQEKWEARWNPKLNSIFLRNPSQPQCEWPVVIRDFQATQDLEQLGRTLSFDGVFRGSPLHVEAEVLLAAPGVGQRMAQQKSTGAKIRSPMVGKVLAVKVQIGDQVCKGDELLIIEAMKMENKIFAPQPGIVEKININPGNQVSVGTELVILKGQETDS